MRPAGLPAFPTSLLALTGFRRLYTPKVETREEGHSLEACMPGEREERKNGRMEEWKNGRAGGGKSGRMEGWKSGRAGE